MKKLILSLLAVFTYANAAKLQIDEFLAANPNIKQIHTGLLQHQFSCKELINGYLNRIRLYNLTTLTNHAPLNAITQLNPQALYAAEKLDAKLSNNKKADGSLFCIPVIVKDNIDVIGLRTTSGSLSLLGTYPIVNAKIITNIENQGGIILAKSSMDEMASGLTGISSLSGRIGNAYNTNYNPGGSSGGSAVSVAAGFAPLAIGTDNSGSVRIPAAYNGIYGLRPSYGLISQDGIFPLGNLDGTAGPMASNIVDLAKLLTIMASSNIQYAQHLNANSLVGKHFAIVKSLNGKSLWNGMPKPIIAIYRQVKANLQAQGAIISEIDLSNYNLNRKNNMAGTVNNVDSYLSNNISNVNEFRLICQGSSRVYGSPKDCLKFINNIKSKNSREYKQVIQIIARNQAYILAIMQQKQLNGLIFPISKSVIASYDKSQIGNQAIIASNSGLPEITFPVAQYNGMPVSLEILGRKFAEHELLNYAYAYQQHYYSFHSPKLLATFRFKDWNISALNTLYLLIGQLSFKTIISKINSNQISPQQSITITQKAISKIPVPAW